MSALTAYARGDLGGVFKSLSSVGQKLAGGNKASQITKQTKSSQADVISWSGCKVSAQTSGRVHTVLTSFLLLLVRTLKRRPTPAR
jgi:hypothetical protein